MMEHGRVMAEGPVEEWKRTMRRVQVVFPGAVVPDGVAVPGALRSQSLGPVLTAVARLTDDSQLDALRALPEVRVNEFPLTLEELFVELFQPVPGLGADEAPGMEAGGTPDRPGGRAARESSHRVGQAPAVAVAPASRERDE